MSDGSTSALKLRRALTGLQFPLSDEAIAAIRTRVFEFVDDMRAQGWQAERIIVAVKRLANDAGLYVSPRVIWSPEIVRGPDSLMVEVVGWCIARYYEGRNDERGS
jgi:hypothetical protein